MKASAHFPPQPSSTYNSKTYHPSPTMISHTSRITNQNQYNQTYYNSKVNAAPCYTSNIVYNNLSLPSSIIIPGFTYP